MKSWRVDRIINALIREIENQIFILENDPAKYDKGTILKDQILLFQNEIDRLTLKREIIYDAFIESSRYDGKNLRKDLDLIDEKIKDIENEINELSYHGNTLNQIHNKINLLKQVVEDLKGQSNSNQDDVQGFDCIIKKVNVFEKQIEIEY